MDALKLRQIFDKLDQALEHPTELLIRGGAAVLAHGLEQRVTLDIDVLPASRFIESDLRRACAAAELGFNPSDKDFAEQDYLEVVPEETLILPRPDPEHAYNTIFRGLRLTVRTPPAADLVIGKLKPSAFHGTPLRSHLTLLGADSLVICGTTTSGCVRASVIDAFSYNLKVSVIEECVFDRGQASHKINLFDMAMKYADVISLKETVDYIRGLPDNLYAPAL